MTKSLRRRQRAASTTEYEGNRMFGDTSTAAGTTGGSCWTDNFHIRVAHGDEEPGIWRSRGLRVLFTLLALVFVLFLIDTSIVRGMLVEGLSVHGTVLRPNIGPLSRRPQNNGPAKQPCLPVNEPFHYCEKSNVGYIYHGKKRKCVSTREDEQFVCYDNSNRFPNLDQCEKHCGPFPRHKYICTVTRTFAPCKSTFFFKKWWFLNKDTSKCEQWDFKNSTCPSNPHGYHHNQMESECIANCVNRRTPLPGCFPEGPGEVCPPEVFNDPYFVHVHPDGVRRCHRSAFQHLKEHRCIDERKRFDTMQECAAACEG